MDQHLQQSIQLIQWMDAEIEGLPIKTDIRTRLVAGCFDVALEHQKAIILLIHNHIYGSSFSLLRPLFEAYIRGLWLYRCATPEEVDLFQKDRLGKKFGQLIAQIEEIDGYDVGTLSKTKRASWSAMSDYTHGGYSQISRRNKEKTIEPNYDENEVIQMIMFANSVGLLAAVEISFLASNQKLSSLLLAKMKDLGSWSGQT